MAETSGEAGAIHARGLRKTYAGRKGQEVVAVTGVDLDVAPGEIVGFLGPNGAGKTTTLKMLATLLKPSGGTANVSGCDLAADPLGVRKRIGYVSQAGSTLPDAPLMLEIESQGRLYGLSTKEARRRGLELMEALDLGGLERRKSQNLSGGQRRRLDIVMGLIHRPELVFLDEPTTGLDPQARANLWEHIRRLRDELGTTIFLTTHYMDEADSLSDRLLIIDKGEIVGEGTATKLKAELKGDSLTLTFSGGEAAETGEEVAAGLEGAANVVRQGNVLFLNLPDGARALPGLIKRLSDAGAEPIGAELSRPTLDDVFLALTGRSLRE
ncbi:ATP-binding cassette domain-containing protein [Pseudoroseicyclus tamaricis]|uniref:ATP-binding cassette domain-containing protein n=1 Tax=Pseudoroseicyclus tamaricis TaxID=2705421 RepID=A0A6B2JMS9_9RHOB|nr:ATP-binding cassette domain-containing protein [Pseudoroseicyclus tamaricis]NDU99966.1 ATP-binding cassette domain-containing protein [Pseudoroseicyclus tamaricis]